VAEPLETDCLIVGAGPGGLIAATYLGRYHRPPVVVDAGQSRAEWIPTSHNVPGFPEGISGREMLDLLREQAIRYGARIVSGTLEGLTRSKDGRFIGTGVGIEVHARRVILATGVDDHVPGFAEVAEGIRSARIRLCPICDGYEVTGHKVGVIGPADRTFREARFLTAFTRDLTLLRLKDHPDPCGEDIERCTASGFEIEGVPTRALEPTEDGVLVHLTDGRVLRFDDVYVAMGARPRAELVKRLGARVAEDGFLQTDSHQRTSVRGLYAVGDVVHELNQISVAAGHAAIAATDAHNGLSCEDRSEEFGWPMQGDNAP
jgi:thioredoxin reductase (NADPH)